VNENINGPSYLSGRFGVIKTAVTCCRLLILSPLIGLTKDSHAEIYFTYPMYR
jgi:hypothetical protein